MLRVSRTLCNKLAPSSFFETLTRHNINTFYGVPDSLLKDFCAYVTDHVSPSHHIITANEGAAVGMAAGHYIATGKVSAVYLQNSGFGNIINPILSLTHREVYNIPVLLLIGWRGQPGVHDEPQHVAQGRLMKELLRASEIPFSVLGPSVMNCASEVEMMVGAAVDHFNEKKTPYALLIERDTFSPYKLVNVGEEVGESLTRESALSIILDAVGAQDVVVSTTGMPSREVFELREKKKQGHHQDFLTVGCMGHCSSIAAGIALSHRGRKVYCLDGDGAAIMHLGTMPVLGNISQQSKLLGNLKHIVINNGAHDSVGGQPTAAASRLGFLTDTALSFGYVTPTKAPVRTREELVAAMQKLKESEELSFLEVAVKKGSRKDLGRPTGTPVQNKEELMMFLQSPTTSHI